jgi:hypothetical protein
MARTLGKNAQKPKPKADLSILANGQEMTQMSNKKMEGKVLILVTRWQ